MMMRNLSRFFYLLSRSIGDANAVKHGRMGQRLARRAERRAVWGWLRKIGL